jgi:hypothetical protein
LKSCPLGCGYKEGRATADDHLMDVENRLMRFGLKYENILATVTDTEATMQKYGKLVKVY